MLLPGSKAASASSRRSRVVCPCAGEDQYAGDKPPVFTIVVGDTGDRYVVPAKSADESTVRLQLADRQQEWLTVYTGGFRAYEPPDEVDGFDRKYAVHSDGKYAADEVHINT